jgi:hypothetical protein
MSVKKHMTHFLSSLKTIEEAKQYLITLRDTTMDGFTLTESRMLWFSLLLYKFRHEQDTPDELWKDARTYILDTLRDQPGDSARKFITSFNEWKQTDFTSFVNEMVGYYLHVIHLKETIEETKEESTINEWKDSYQKLILKIRSSAERMGFLQILDEKVREVERVRHSIVQDMMKRAYWDMLEDDVRHQRYATVICQLTELKDLIKEIIPNRYHPDLHEQFDIDYVRHRIETETLDQDYIVQLCKWVMDSMKEWDSESARPLYEREISTWENIIGTLEWPTFIRFSLELCTVLALDAKTRISIWKSLVREQN